MCVFFTLSDRASTIASSKRGCQSGTWSPGQENIRVTSTKLQRERKNTNFIMHLLRLQLDIHLVITQQSSIASPIDLHSNPND